MPSIKSILRAISCTFLMVLVIPAKLFAADWYVSPSGQDWYSGDSQANLLKTYLKVFRLPKLVTLSLLWTVLIETQISITAKSWVPIQII